MFHRLPPPPRFTLPPPPMLPLNIFNSKNLLHLTCSSIRQEINPHSILISCTIFLLISILLTLLFMYIQFYYRHKTSLKHCHSKPTSSISRNSSICTDRSYETISSGIYLQSINTSLSTNPSQIIYNHYHQISS